MAAVVAVMLADVTALIVGMAAEVEKMKLADVVGPAESAEITA
jgi:hypothetical protein